MSRRVPRAFSDVKCDKTDYRQYDTKLDQCDALIHTDFKGKACPFYKKKKTANCLGQLTAELINA